MWAHRAVLQATMGSTRFTQWLGENARNADALEIKGWVLDSGSTFWADTSYVLAIMGPFESGLKEVEGDTATLADAYFIIRGLEQHVARHCGGGQPFTTLLQNAVEYAAAPLGANPTLEAEFVSTLPALWQKRREFMWHNSMATAALVDPRWVHCTLFGLRACPMPFE